MLGAKKRGVRSNPPVYGSGDELKGCRCSAFVEICCMVCSFLVYIKFFCCNLDGGVKTVS